MFRNDGQRPSDARSDQENHSTEEVSRENSPAPAERIEPKGGPEGPPDGADSTSPSAPDQPIVDWMEAVRELRERAKVPDPPSSHAPDATLADEEPADRRVADDKDAAVEDATSATESPDDSDLGHLTARQRRRRIKGRRLASPEEQAARKKTFTPEQRLLLLDTWQRSQLPAKDFAALVGVSKHTLYKWKQLFQEQGPAGLMDQPRGARRGSRLPEVTKRTILLLKQQHPEWGCGRISDMLVRGPALPASASAVARVLREAGYEVVDEPTRPHPPKQARFERARPNQLWQTDLFTFVLKRQNRRVYLVAFMDDHSRFIVSFGVHASASTALVIEALEAGLASWGPPEEILTDNGPQYVTWRGKSQFSRHLEKRGIKQIIARPRRPQTLGKIERFWGTMWREFLETAVFHDLNDARTRIGWFIDYYNFQRVHRGLDGLVPADRFFGAAPDVLKTLKERAQANALELARHGQPKKPFYMTGQIDGRPFSVHAEGERVVLRKEGEDREEIELSPAASNSDERPDQTPEDASSPSDSASTLCPRREPEDAQGEPGCLPPSAPGQSVLDEQRFWKLLDTPTPSDRREEQEGDEPEADRDDSQPRDDEQGGDA